MLQVQLDGLIGFICIILWHGWLFTVWMEFTDGFMSHTWLRRAFSKQLLHELFYVPYSREWIEGIIVEEGMGVYGGWGQPWVGLWTTPKLANGWHQNWWMADIKIYIWLMSKLAYGSWQLDDLMDFIHFHFTSYYDHLHVVILEHEFVPTFGPDSWASTLKSRGGLRQGWAAFLPYIRVGFLSVIHHSSGIVLSQLVSSI